MRGMRLGSVLGLDIRIDYSWFIIFFLILWTFTAGVFPNAAPHASTTAHVLMGLAGTLLFFASLLAHEIAHSVVARQRGIPVEGITLFIFGGMAHTRMEAEEPKDEFVVAGVGPLASLVLAGLFAAGAAAGRALGWGEPVTDVAGYLAFINVVLAVFNLLPGFPLDGGRLFRAGAWHFTKDLRKATRWATLGGKILGYVLVAVGLLQIFAGGLIGGIWLVFIGWFVRTAAEASFRQHVLRQTLEGVRARELMVGSPETVPAAASLEEFVDERILRGRHRRYPVTAGGRAVGLVTLDQVKEVPREEWSRRTVEHVMTPLDDLQTAAPDEDMVTVLERLGRNADRPLLVVEDGALVGILTRGDLTRWIERAELLER